MKKNKEQSTEQENKETAQSTEQVKTDTEQTTEATEAVTEEKATEEKATEEDALAALQSKYDQLNDTLLRTMAEYDNYRKRTLREKADLIKTGGESVLIGVISVLDDVERGLQAMETAQDIEGVKEGMRLIHTKMSGFMKQNGVTPIETEALPLDTDVHEAIATIPAPNEALKGKIVDCVQKGYYLHDKVIRFAKVVVGE
ncbi:MAG TPA: nucleotide exchange factor GrpE [Bacteroidales bacterium]|nr:nucleotide exchange factor GrpE [Bacteroidales bacterium]